MDNRGAGQRSSGSGASLLSMQRMAGNQAVADLLRRSQGRELDPPTRHVFEKGFGEPMGSVRVHEGAGCEEAVNAMGARAFTIGEDVVLGKAGGDQHVLAHEVAHVVQQRKGGPTPELDPGALHEVAARRAADAVLGGGAHADVGSGTAVGVARDALPGEQMRGDKHPLTGQRRAREPVATSPPLPKVDVTHEPATSSYLVTVNGIPVARAGIHEGADARLDVEATSAGVTIVLKHHGGAELMRVADPGATLAVPVTLSEVEMTQPRSPRGVGPALPASPTADWKTTAPLLIGPPGSLRWPDTTLGEGDLKPSLPPGSLGEFEHELRAGTKEIQGVVFDPDKRDEVIGYEVPSTAGMTRLVDRDGNQVYETEIGLEAPLLDPIDLIPTPGTAVKGAGVVGKVGLKLLGKKAAAKGASVPLAVLVRLRSVSKALLARSVRKGAEEAAGIVCRITEQGLAHSFDRHAAQWFGRNVARETHLHLWRDLVQRATATGRVFPWSLREFPTVARLAYIEGKPFVVQFFRETGEIATAFVPNSNQLREMARLLMLAK